MEGTEDFEEVWLKEALNRYKDISKDKSKLIDADLVIKEAKSKYK
ncbi:hypothetical protein ASZ90_004479 [hydrocarbon metagenome]|uniref:Uncharacterized protein n=1 Tax=hydrocarbon metagenome TaxID=938273 RepID=A0A0W8FY53_9ZZZZ